MKKLMFAAALTSPLELTSQILTVGMTMAPTSCMKPKVVAATVRL